MSESFADNTIYSTKPNKARTEIPIADTSLVLVIETYRTATGLLKSVASVWRYDPKSRLMSAAFGSNGDYRKELVAKRGVRATAHAVRMQQAEAMGFIDVIYPEVKLHYKLGQVSTPAEPKSSSSAHAGVTLSPAAATSDQPVDWMRERLYQGPKAA